MPATGTLTVACCDIQQDEATCQASVAWSSAHTTTPKVTLGSTALDSTASGSKTPAIGNGPQTVALNDGTAALDSKTVTGSCVRFTAWNGSVCAASVAHYSEFKLVVYADRGAYIGVVKESGEVPLVNNTGYTSGAAIPVAQCGIWDKLLPNGWPMASCQTPGAGGNIRRNFPIDPLNGSLEKEYTGVVPVGAVWRDVVYGTDLPYAKYGVGQTGLWLDTKEGIYYSRADDRYHLRLTTDTFATNKVVGTGDFKYLTLFSN